MASKYENGISQNEDSYDGKFGGGPQGIKSSTPKQSDHTQATRTSSNNVEKPFGAKDSTAKQAVEINGNSLCFILQLG